MKSTVVKFCLVLFAFSFICVDAFSWGQKGHDVTCAIAQEHLNCRARKVVDNLLDGKSLVYWANWLDNASNTPEYEYTKTWHYKNVDASETYETAALNKNGDVVSALYEQIAVLEDSGASKEEKALALKIVVHLVGDMHCPMHMGHLSDLGGNKWQVQYFNSGTNLHKVWDSSVLESGHNWSVSEWVGEIDRVKRKQAKSLAAGTPDDWAKETCSLCPQIYDTTPVGSKLSYDYIARWTPVIEDQLLKAGLRLAAVLNEVL